MTPGNNRVTQPATLPAVTVYTANFVQLSPYTASVLPAGSGTVAVNPLPQTYAGASGSFFVARQPVTLSASPTGAYNFVTWGGTSAPWSANPKPDYVPDAAAVYSVTASFSTDPLTTITTNPGGFWFTVDGNYYKGPQSFTADLFSGWGSGSNHVLTGFSPSQPYSVNTRYLFDSWSDGGALSHNVTVQPAGSTISGSFTAQYVPIVYAKSKLRRDGVAEPDLIGRLLQRRHACHGLCDEGERMASDGVDGRSFNQAQRPDVDGFRRGAGGCELQHVCHAVQGVDPLAGQHEEGWRGRDSENQGHRVFEQQHRIREQCISRFHVRQCERG